MEIYATQKMDTNKMEEDTNPRVKIKALDLEIQTLKDAALICDNLRIIFDNLEIFDPKVAENCYENLLEICDIIEQHRIGEKCDVE